MKLFLCTYLLIASSAQAMQLITSWLYPPHTYFKQGIQKGDLQDVAYALGQDPELLKMRFEHDTTPLHLTVINARCPTCMGASNQDLVTMATKYQVCQDIITLLVQHGADIHASFFESRKKPTAFYTKRDTPLHFACNNGCAKTIRTLLACGADATRFGFDGSSVKGNYTPLHYLAENGKIANSKECLTDAIAALVEHGADINALNTCGLTPLKTAIRYGMESPYLLNIAHALIQAGADVNLGSPLHSALSIAWQRPQDGYTLVEALLSKGANPLAKEFVLGETALQIAEYFASCQSTEEVGKQLVALFQNHLKKVE